MITNDEARATRLAYLRDAEQALLMLQTNFSSLPSEDNFGLWTATNNLLETLAWVSRQVTEFHDSPDTIAYYERTIR